MSVTHSLDCSNCQKVIWFWPGIVIPNKPDKGGRFDFYTENELNNYKWNKVCPACGAELVYDAKIPTKESVSGSGISKGDYKEFWSIELGASGNAQREYKIKHPDAEFNKYGALKIKSASQLDKVLKERGMCVLTEDREYREKTREELDAARDMQ